MHVGYILCQVHVWKWPVKKYKHIWSQTHRSCIRVAVTVVNTKSHNVACRNVHRILVRGVNAPLPPEAKKILKI